jgi:hypothetical protein
MDKTIVKEFINKFVIQVDEKRKVFTKKQLEILKGVATTDIVEAIERIHDNVLKAKVAKIDKIKHDKELGEYTVFLEDGFRYIVVGEEKPSIDDILLPCECSDDAETLGKCPMCMDQGIIDEDGTECPMCEGEGSCHVCDGEGVIRLSVGMEESSHMHQEEDEKPLSDKHQLFTESEEEFDNEDVAKFVSEYLFNLDNLYYQNFTDFNEIYKDFFDPETLDYPEILFPAYFTPFMDNFTKETDGKYYGVVELGGDSLLLTIEEKDGKFTIVKMETDCTMADSAPELHADEAVQCECVVNSVNGAPDKDCENCHATGVIVCPICLGTEWIELAPNTLHPEDIEDPKRYKNGVKELYDIHLNEKK